MCTKAKSPHGPRSIAEADPRVVAALGRRWEFIGVGIVDDKERDRPDLRVVWYAYDTDQTVEAITDDGGAEVCDVRLFTSQPPFTDGEEARANEIVASSHRLPGARDGRGLPVEVTDPGDASHEYHVCGPILAPFGF